MRGRLVPHHRNRVIEGRELPTSFRPRECHRLLSLPPVLRGAGTGWTPARGPAWSGHGPRSTTRRLIRKIRSWRTPYPKRQQPSLPNQGIHWSSPEDRHKVSCQLSALVSSHRPAEEPNSEALPRQRDERQCETRTMRFFWNIYAKVHQNMTEN